MNFLRLFAVSIVAFAVLDLAWLGFIIKPFNLAQLAEIGRFKDGQFDLWYAPAIGVYFLMALSMVYFVMPKIGAEDPFWLAFLTGALMGFLVYGVFDLTNLAILKNYPLAFAVVDMTWGSFAYGVVALITKAVRDL